MKITIVQEQYLTYINYYDLEIPDKEYEELMKLDEEEQEIRIYNLFSNKKDNGLLPTESTLDIQEWGLEIDWWKKED